MAVWFTIAVLTLTQLCSRLVGLGLRPRPRARNSQPPPCVSASGCANASVYCHLDPSPLVIHQRRVVVAATHLRWRTRRTSLLPSLPVASSRSPQRQRIRFTLFGPLGRLC